MTLEPNERIEAANAILQFLKEKYKNITISDTAQVLKVAQAAVYRKPKGESFFEERL